MSSPTFVHTQPQRPQPESSAVAPDGGAGAPFERFTRRCPQHGLDLVILPNLRLRCPAGHRPTWWQVWDRQAQAAVAIGGGMKDLVPMRAGRSAPRRRVERGRRRRPSRPSVSVRAA
jgi:hypothetical protein